MLKVKLSLYLINYASCHKDVCGSEVWAPCILNPKKDRGQIHTRAVSLPRIGGTVWRLFDLSGESNPTFSGAHPRVSCCIHRAFLVSHVMLTLETEGGYMCRPFNVIFIKFRYPFLRNVSSTDTKFGIRVVGASLHIYWLASSAVLANIF